MPAPSEPINSGSSGKIISPPMSFSKLASPSSRTVHGKLIVRVLTSEAPESGVKLASWLSIRRSYVRQILKAQQLHVAGSRFLRRH